MADNFVDPFDMDMTDIFDDLHGFGDFPAVKPDVGAYAPYEREMPPKLHVKAEPVYPTPAPVPYDPNTEPIPRSNGMSSDEVEHQKQLRRRAQIAASGRRGRAKRKREKLDLEARNKKLEDENRALQSTIAELQFEMQRANSEKQRSIYEMENEILKKQVTEHRNFVDQVQKLMRGPDTSKIERQRLIQQGSNSAVAQLLGLLYASDGDPSWKTLKRTPFSTDEFEFKCAKYLFLPFNTNARTAKRFSLRADILCKAKTKYVAKVLWDSCFDTGKDYDSFIASEMLSEGKVEDVKDVKVALKEVDAFAKEKQHVGIMEGSKMMEVAQRNEAFKATGSVEDIFRESETTKIRKHVQVKKRKSGEESTVERLSVVTIRTGLRVQVPFFETDKKEDEEVIIVATIASDTLQNLTEKEEKVVRDGSTRITGYVFRNRANGNCLVSILWSKPISKDGWVGYRPQDEVQIREDGSPSPRFEKVSSMFMTSAAQQARKLERAVAERAAKAEAAEAAAQADGDVEVKGEES